MRNGERGATSTTARQQGADRGRRPPVWYARGFWGCVLVALTGALVYANTLHVPFVFDDQTSIVDNGIIHDLSGFLAGAGMKYNPRRFVSYLTLAINYRIGGLDVTGYHLFNLAAHIVTACLVYALGALAFRTPLLRDSRLAGQGRMIALCAALLFVVHPVQTQAVTYVVQRAASLATLFYLLTAVLYVWGRLRSEGAETGSYLLFAGAACAALLALLSKEIAVTLPVAIVLCELAFFRRSPRRKVLLAGLLLAATAAVAVGLLAGPGTVGERLAEVGERLAASQIISRHDYLVTQFPVIVTYLRLLLFPVRQTLDYDYPVYTTLFTPPVLLSLTLLLALLALAGGLLWITREPGAGMRDRQAGRALTGSPPPIADPGVRLAGFGLFWFFLTLAVESSVIPIADVIYEHRLYLPSAGIFLAAATALFLLVRGRSAIALGVTATLVVTLGVATWNRNQVWRDELTLWEDIVSKAPGKARPHNGYGLALEKRGRLAEAVAQYQLALRLNPGYADAYFHLGNALQKQGDADRSAQAYQAALALEPRHVRALNNLGSLYYNQRHYAAAIEAFEKALAIDPAFPLANYNLANSYRDVGRLDQAVEHYQATLRRRPDLVAARQGLARIFLAQGRPDQAIEHLEALVARQPNDAVAHHLLGLAYAATGRRDQALAHVETAVRLVPDEPTFRESLAALRE